MKVYGIKNCDTVKKALKYLDTNKIDYEFIDYKKVAPNKTLLTKWKKELGELPVNKRGPTFRKIKDDFENANAAQKIQLLIDNSSAIKRPLVEVNGVAKLLGFDESVWSESL